MKAIEGVANITKSNWSAARRVILRYKTPAHARLTVPCPRPHSHPRRKGRHKHKYTRYGGANPLSAQKEEVEPTDQQNRQGMEMRRRRRRRELADAPLGTKCAIKP